MARVTAASVTKSWVRSSRICSSTVIIELQGKAAPEDCQLAGHTSWLEELDVTAPQGYALMRTTVSFANDFVALGAMNCAIEIIAWAFEPMRTTCPMSMA